MAAHRSVPERRSVACGQGQARRAHPRGAEIQGDAGAVAAAARRRARYSLSDLNKEFSRIYVYAALIADQDTRVAKYRAMKQEMDQLGSSFGAETAFVEPEILKIDRATIDSFIAKEPKLAPYTFYLHDLLRRQAHTLSEPEEKIIADAGLMSSAPSDVYGVFTNADFPFPTITLADGNDAQARPGHILRFAFAAEPRRPQEGLRHVLRRARRLPRHDRNGAECRGPEGHVLHAGAEVSDHARLGARTGHHPDLGLHEADRRREREPADVPSLSQSAQADARPQRSALLRSLRAARRQRRSSSTRSTRRRRTSSARSRRSAPATPA